jgi:hypothetical protein
MFHERNYSVPTMKSRRRTTSVPKGVDEVPVLIVSPGAGGSATATLLAKYGVESLVVAASSTELGRSRRH